VAVNLGFVPVPITVSLPVDGDFVAALQASSNWPAGSGVSLKFMGTGTTTWTATVATNRAQWDKTAAQVASVLATDQRSVELLYTESDGSVLVWGRGSVNVV
jgi:hypothetical protein